MRKSQIFLGAAAVLVLAMQLQAGGFWLVLGNPEASAPARAMNAVLTVKSAGCADPAATQVSGVAFGIVGGKRQSIPLKLAALTEPGMFAVARQWPAEGKWVVQLVGKNGGAVTSTLVAAGPDGLDRQHAKFIAMRQPTAAEVDALLGGSDPAAIAQK